MTERIERYQYGGADGQRVRQAGARANVPGVRHLPGLECRADAGEAVRVIRLHGVSLVRWRCGRPPEIAQDGWRCALADRQGSAALELDAAGRAISREAYYPYGGTAVWVARGDADGKLKTHRHAGKERDATGLMYYGFRYYAPWLGRWASPDPAFTVDGLNVFAMVRNNPATLTDAHGLYAGEEDDTERAVGLSRIRARGLAELRRKYSDVARAAHRNIHLAERVAHYVSARLHTTTLATHGQALLRTPEGRLIDWMIGGAHHLEAVEQARQAFEQVMALTAALLTRHRMMDGEQIVLYLNHNDDGEAISYSGDPHRRIFLNLRDQSMLMQPQRGAMLLLRESAHLAAGTQPIWNLPVPAGVNPGDMAQQVRPGLAANLQRLNRNGRFVEAYAGALSENQLTINVAREAAQADSRVAARIVPRNTDSVSALAFALGLDILRQECATRPPMPVEDRRETRGGWQRASQR